MKEKGGFASQDEAYDAGVEAYADWKHGNIGITSDKVLLDDFFQSWIEKIVKPNVTPSTYNQYKERYRCHIQSRLGGAVLQKVKPRDVDALIRGMAAQGKSRQTILATFTVLNSLFKYAVYPAELISVSPTQYISVPQSARNHVVERTIISKEEFAALLDTCERKARIHFYRIPLMLGYYAGLRIGEALGLCWEDIDFERKIITIRQQLHPGKHKYFTKPKTTTSARDIAMSDTLASELKAWRKKQAENRMKLGTSYHLAYEMNEDHALVTSLVLDGPPANAQERHLVCTNRFGLPTERISLMTFLRREGTNFHSLRHTHATRLIEAGAKPVDVAARLGHADVAITQNLYAHDTEKMARETAKIVDEVM